MSVDRELLELAAKVAGLRYHDWVGVGLREQAVHGVPHAGYDGSPLWNPLADDGDALRLAVKLNLLVDCASQCARPLSDEMGWFDGDPDEDEFAATRRAIVRAAAEIGRSM